MKVRVALHNYVGQLDQQIIEVDEDDSDEVSNQIHEALECWLLSPGDTIVILEA
jgi:hypothetical protein